MKVFTVKMNKLTPLKVYFFAVLLVSVSNINKELFTALKFKNLVKINKNRSKFTINSKKYFKNPKISIAKSYSVV